MSPSSLLHRVWLKLTGRSATQISLPPPTGDTVTILVPGYRGSFLETGDPGAERAWITVGQGLSRGDRSLALPFPGQRPVPAYGPLQPGGPITRIAVPFVSVDAYGTFLEYGRDHLPGLVAFSYDWREDVRKSAAALGALIEQLVAQGRRHVNIVAHSMGGLVTMQCLLQGERPWAAAAAVKRVVTVGTPYGGSPGLFGDLLVGTQTARNRALLTPEALFTFASTFQLLPPRGDFFVGPDDQPLAAWDALAPEGWWTRGWGPFEDPTLRENEAYRTQLLRMLQANRELYAALAPRRAPPPPPFELLVVVGTGNSTKIGIRVVEGRVDLKNPRRGDGDGSVPSSHAQPLLPLAYHRLEGRSEHVALMADRDVLHAIKRFLGGETVGTPAHTLPS